MRGSTFTAALYKQTSSLYSKQYLIQSLGYDSRVACSYVIDKYIDSVCLVTFCWQE